MSQHKAYDDTSEVDRGDYTKRVVWSTSDFDDDSHLMLFVTIPPRTEQRWHVHNLQTELYLVLDGEAEIYLDDETFVARPGDTFITTPGVKHKFWNKGDQPFRVAVFKKDVDEEVDDTIWLE